jgi:hypothetical protein
MGKELDETQLDILMHHLDKDGKGYIDFDGFLNGMLLFIAQSQSQVPATATPLQDTLSEIPSSTTSNNNNNNNSLYSTSNSQRVLDKIQLHKQLKDVFTSRTRSFSIDSDKTQHPVDKQKTIYTNEDEILSRDNEQHSKRDRSSSCTFQHNTTQHNRVLAFL